MALNGTSQWSLLLWTAFLLNLSLKFVVLDCFLVMAVGLVLIYEVFGKLRSS